jgi:hypothetical protein
VCRALEDCLPLLLYRFAHGGLLVLLLQACLLTAADYFLWQAAWLPLARLQQVI